MSYKNLEIWQIAREVSIKIHEMTLKELPDFEKYETGSQIRRSSKSVRANITEGYGRRRYKSDYIRFLVFAQASNDETIDHLRTLFESGSLKNKGTYTEINSDLKKLGIKIRLYLDALTKK